STLTATAMSVAWMTGKSLAKTASTPIMLTRRSSGCRIRRSRPGARTIPRSSWAGRVSVDYAGVPRSPPSRRGGAVGRRHAREFWEAPLAARLSGVVRLLFAPHRPAHAPPGGDGSRDLGGNARRLLVGPGDPPSMAVHRGALGHRCDGDVSDLFRSNERGIRARRPDGRSGAVPARSVGRLALDSYGPGDDRFLRGPASPSAVMTLRLR